MLIFLFFFSFTFEFAVYCSGHHFWTSENCRGIHQWRLHGIHQQILQKLRMHIWSFPGPKLKITSKFASHVPRYIISLSQTQWLKTGTFFQASLNECKDVCVCLSSHTIFAQNIIINIIHFSWIDRVFTNWNESEECRGILTQYFTYLFKGKNENFTL